MLLSPGKARAHVLCIYSTMFLPIILSGRFSKDSVGVAFLTSNVMLLLLQIVYTSETFPLHFSLHKCIHHIPACTLHLVVAMFDALASHRLFIVSVFAEFCNLRSQLHGHRYGNVALPLPLCHIREHAELLALLLVLLAVSHSNYIFI